MKYFVSYTTIDKEITTELLEYFSNYLSDSGTVYIDILNNDSVNKQERVISELDSSDKIILIETENVYKSKWVQAELTRAQFLKIPVKIISVEDLKSLIYT